MDRIFRIIAMLLAALGCWGAAQAQAVFTEVAERAGVADSERNAINANQYWGDFDNDGWLDVYVSTFGEIVTGRVSRDGAQLPDTVLAMPPRLYRNNRDGTFTDVAARVGVADTAIFVGGPWGDFDNDGDLDLFVTAGNPPQGLASLQTWLHQNNGDGTFTDVTTRAGIRSGPSGNVSWVDYDTDGWLDFYLCRAPAWDAQGNIDLANSIPSQLYRNRGDGTFAEVSAAGMAEYGNGGMWGDYDDDGDLDFYLVGMEFFPNPSRLYRNNGDGTFTDVAGSARVGDQPEVQSINAAWGDYDNDGDLDLFRGNNNAANNLFQNNGDGTFTDVAAHARVVDDKIGFTDGGVWGDFDNDGFLDLFVLNLASSSPCRLYRNNGDNTFTDVGIEAGVNTPDGAGAAWGDFDNDGFLDLFMGVFHLIDGAYVAAPNLLFHNEGNANHWLVVQLRGTISNRDAIGARVIAVTGKSRQRRDVESTGPGWNSQPSLPVEFGLGEATVVDSLLIRWPSGIEQVLTQVEVDQYLMLEESRGREPTAVEEAERGGRPPGFVLRQNYPNPFNGETAIHFEVPVGAEVELGVYDLAGQRVARLVRGQREAGSYAVTWNGRDDGGRVLASGVYLYRLRAGDREMSRRLLLVR